MRVFPNGFLWKTPFFQLLIKRLIQNPLFPVLFFFEFLAVTMQETFQPLETLSQTCRRLSNTWKPCRKPAGDFQQLPKPCRKLAGDFRQLPKPCRKLAGNFRQAPKTCRKPAGNLPNHLTGCCKPVFVCCLSFLCSFFTVIFGRQEIKLPGDIKA